MIIKLDFCNKCTCYIGILFLLTNIYYKIMEYITVDNSPKLHPLPLHNAQPDQLTYSGVSSLHKSNSYPHNIIDVLGKVGIHITAKQLQDEFKHLALLSTNFENSQNRTCDVSFATSIGNISVQLNTLRDGNTTVHQNQQVTFTVKQPEYVRQQLLSKLLTNPVFSNDVDLSINDLNYYYISYNGSVGRGYDGQKFNVNRTVLDYMGFPMTSKVICIYAFGAITSF